MMTGRCHKCGRIVRRFDEARLIEHEAPECEWFKATMTTMNEVAGLVALEPGTNEPEPRVTLVQLVQMHLRFVENLSRVIGLPMPREPADQVFPEERLCHRIRELVRFAGAHGYAFAPDGDDLVERTP